MSSPRRRGWLAASCVNAVALLALCAYVLSLAIPSSEAVRLRNALVFGVATEHELQFTPESLPSDFVAERAGPTRGMQDALRGIAMTQGDGDWERALAIAAHLTLNARDSGPIQADLATAYRGIVEQGRGYCADFTQVFLGLAHAAGIFAREWGFSFDRFGGDGHAFVEIYDRQRQRWIWIDVFNNIHAIDAATQEPVGALRFREYIRSGVGELRIVRNGPGRLGYPHETKLIEFYRRGADQWYLWMSNAVFSYEANPAVSIAGRISRAAEQLVAVAVGVHPSIRAIRSLENEPYIADMVRLRERLAVFAAVAALLLVSLLTIVLLWARAGRRPASFDRPGTLGT